MPKSYIMIISIVIIAQSQRDDLESLGYVLSALFHGSLPWDNKDRDTWQIKMSTPGSTLFRDMDPSFLEYWKDVRSLAFKETPDYCSLKSRFVQCWERKGFGGLPGEYDWVGLFNRLNASGGGGGGGGREKTLGVVLLDNASDNLPAVSISVAAPPPVMASGNPSHSAH